MKRFARAKPPSPLEYRINSQVFYLKFVRRTCCSESKPSRFRSTITKCCETTLGGKGDNGAFRISYDALDGRYLRQNPFLELIRSGYIGAHAEPTADLAHLVNAILKDHRAVIAAIHSFAERDV